MMPRVPSTSLDGGVSRAEALDDRPPPPRLVPGLKSASIRRIRAGNKREAILEAAAALFEADGYRNATMESVAVTVGVSKATLYHYFSSKDEILYHLTAEYFNQLISRQEDPARTAQAQHAQLQCIMTDLLDFCGTKRGHLSAYLQHFDELSDDYKKHIDLQRRHYEALVGQVLDAGIASREFRPLDARLVSLALYGMCNWSYRWYRQDGPLTMDEIGELFADLLLTGLTPRPAPAAN